MERLRGTFRSVYLVIFGETIHVLHKDLPRILQQSASIEAAVYRSFLAGRIVDRIKALAGVGGGGAQQKNPLVKLADKLRFKRVTLVIRKRDVSGYWHYFKNRDLGFVFRVDRDHAVHVAGVRPGSPASRMGISHSWRLLVINGKHVKADTDVQDQLANTKLPIYCLFRAPRTEKDDEEAEIDSSDAKELSASGMRLITMSLGIMQSFNGIQRIDIEWPELFTKVMEILANFTFNFNFFQPDCSVSSPYWYTWLGFTVAPYAMMAPITFSYLVVRWLSFRESRGDPQYRDVQSWLLLNAWGRAMLTILLLFIQMHMTKLSSPFQCYTLKDGSAVMVDSQDIYCDLADDQYFLIFTVACVFWVIFAAGFATLNVCLYWSYHWQAGTKTRDRIPIYVAAVEMSVENMRGWVEVVRLRVLSNIVAVRTYPSVKDQEAQERRAFMEAKMKQRGVAVVPETKAGRELDKELADMRKRKATLEDEVNLREIKMKWKNKEKFTEKQAWPDRLDGSYVTYGWVLIFSTFFRQFALMLSALVSNDFPPFGAASQSLVFMINFGALILLFPYNARLLNIEESVLTGCMAFLTFMAAFKEMLSKHNQAPQYTGTISATSTLIDVLVLVIVSVICGTMVFNFYIIVGGAVKTESDDQILNKAYYDTAMQQERLREEEERGVFTRQREEEARLEEDEHERAFWDNPLQNVEREVTGLKMIPLKEPECVELDKCISAITGPFAEELREKRAAFESNVQRKRDAMMTRQEMEAEELRQMRWEEWRQRKADTFWARHEAKEREWMMREDPRLKHEAFMQEVLLATEKFEQECMEAAECEQREVEEWNANLEAAERSVMAVEDFWSFEARVWDNLQRKEPESRVRELRVMAQEEYKQREVEETNLRLEALFLELMQKEEERQRKVEEWNAALEAQAREAMELAEEERREYDDMAEGLRLQIEKEHMKALQKEELKKMRKEEKQQNKYLASVQATEEFELSCMVAEERRVRQVEELAIRLEAQNLEEMQREDQRQREVNAYLQKLEEEERHKMTEEDDYAQSFWTDVNSMLEVVRDRTGMELNDPLMLARAAAELRRERTQMTKEDDLAEEVRVHDRVRLEIEEADRERKQQEPETPRADPQEREEAGPAELEAEDLDEALADVSEEKQRRKKRSKDRKNQVGSVELEAQDLDEALADVQEEKPGKKKRKERKNQAIIEETEETTIGKEELESEEGKEEEPKPPKVHLKEAGPAELEAEDLDEALADVSEEKQRRKKRSKDRKNQVGSVELEAQDLDEALADVQEEKPGKKKRKERKNQAIIEETEETTIGKEELESEEGKEEEPKPPKVHLKEAGPAELEAEDLDEALADVSEEKQRRKKRSKDRKNQAKDEPESKEGEEEEPKPPKVDPKEAGDVEVEAEDLDEALADVSEEKQRKKKRSKDRKNQARSEETETAKKGTEEPEKDEAGDVEVEAEDLDEALADVSEEKQRKKKRSKDRKNQARDEPQSKQDKQGEEEELDPPKVDGPEAGSAEEAEDVDADANKEKRRKKKRTKERKNQAKADDEEKDEPASEEDKEEAGSAEEAEDVDADANKEKRRRKKRTKERKNQAKADDEEKDEPASGEDKEEAGSAEEAEDVDADANKEKRRRKKRTKERKNQAKADDEEKDEPASEEDKEEAGSAEEAEDVDADANKEKRRRKKRTKERKNQAKADDEEKDEPASEEDKEEAGSAEEAEDVDADANKEKRRRKKRTKERKNQAKADDEEKDEPASEEDKEEAGSPEEEEDVDADANKEKRRRKKRTKERKNQAKADEEKDEPASEDEEERRTKHKDKHKEDSLSADELDANPDKKKRRRKRTSSRKRHD
ncbi:unnamed protein product [Cladocopium goreaui]|uniref:Uncharacterized protein n=1 Tax=Cladocopium goreaui TaxID=2562237 RepID=A0A9P1GSJ4_9DINO|nr:unnamed protein product [Cladocopium goreaui]